jgi:translation initiation factor 5B
MGHVDHGKTTLLDRIRNTALAAREAGGITQHIGASEVPIATIEKICGPLLKAANIKITIPGLLLIDTPGHEAFTNLRRRGGSVADLAILVVSIADGFAPQTIEAIEILKEYKTPFILAANKVDLITGWHDSKSRSVMESLGKQSESVAAELDSKIYEMVGKLSEYGFNSERFDRIKDFQREIAIVPISAKTGEGISELLMVATGLAQKYMEIKLNIEIKGPGKGSILEKSEVRGLGTTIDVILYDGSLKVNDTIAFATVDSVATAKIKALLKPKPLNQIGESLSKYTYVDEVSAASGIKISGNGLDDAMPGSPVVQVIEGEDYTSEVKTEMGDVFKTEITGLVLKADSIGSLEAISKLLSTEGFKVSKKGVGNVSKRDITDAFAMYAADPLSAMVLAFNVGIGEDAQEASQASGVKVISGNIIYKLIDDCKAYVDEKKKSAMQRIEDRIVLPGMVEVLPNSCFRVSHPAVFGVAVMSGRIMPGYQLINNMGEVVGKIKEMQSEKAPLEVAKKGEKLAISMNEPAFGRQVRESQMLYTNVGDEDFFRLSNEFSYLMSDEEAELLNKIMEIKQKARYKKV